MKFFREQKSHRKTIGITGAGTSATQVVIDQTPRREIILGDGSTSFKVYDPLDSSAPFETIQTVALTTDFAVNQYVLNLSGNGQLFVTSQVVSLGGGGITALEVLIEFLDRDHMLEARTEIWLPSKEGVARNAAAASYVWGPLAAGSYILASRIEPRHFLKARVSFRADAGVADAATRVHVGWFHDGGVAFSPEQ